MKVLPVIAALFISLLLPSFTGRQLTFEETQKTYPRVRMAYERKEELFFMKCRSREIPETFGNIYIRAFKQEGTLEIWVQRPGGEFALFNEYKVYAQSGTLGPKRQQGDAQVPEGFYHIIDFNPFSNYHLSLGINYPNESDMKLSHAPKKGGDIYIHGGQVSAGCLAMTDYYIEDIYMAAVKARSFGQQQIPVHIFPFKMSPQNVNYYSNVVEFKKHAKFWRSLFTAYQWFEKTKRLPEVEVSQDGNYQVSAPSAFSASK